MDGITETLLKKLENRSHQIISELVTFLITNRKHNYSIFTRTVIDSLYALIEALPIIEPRESAKNIENIIWNLCLVLDEDVRLNRTSRYGNLNYGWLYPMANDAMRVVFLSGSLVEGSDTAQLWRSIEEYPDKLSRRRKELAREVYLWDLCSYLHLLLAYRLWRGQKYDKQVIEASYRLINELEDYADLPAHLIGYMLFLLKKVEESEIVKPDLQYKETYHELKWERNYRNICYTIYNGLTLGVEQDGLVNEIEYLLNGHEKKERLRKTDLAAFLLLSSKLLMLNGRKVNIPFFTYENVEGMFFGVIIYTYLNVIASLEMERKGSLKLDENGFRNRFLEGLRIKFGNLASSENFRCRGFSDICVVNPQNPDESIVTEIKIWRGPKYYQDGITQALGYLRSNEDIVIMIAIKKNGSSYDFPKSLRESIEEHADYVKSSFSKGVIKKAALTFFEDAYFYSEHYKRPNTERKVRVYHIFLEI